MKIKIIWISNIKGINCIMLIKLKMVEMVIRLIRLIGMIPHILWQRWTSTDYINSTTWRKCGRNWKTSLKNDVRNCNKKLVSKNRQVRRSNNFESVTRCTMSFFNLKSRKCIIRKCSRRLRYLVPMETRLIRIVFMRFIWKVLLHIWNIWRIIISLLPLKIMAKFRGLTLWILRNDYKPNRRERM